MRIRDHHEFFSIWAEVCDGSKADLRTANIQVCLAQWESDGLKYRRSCVQSTERTSFCYLPGRSGDRGDVATFQRVFCGFRMATQFCRVFLGFASWFAGPSLVPHTRSSICTRRWRHLLRSCTRLINIGVGARLNRMHGSARSHCRLGVRRPEPSTSDL
jgi:hypothetical protein